MGIESHIKTFVDLLSPAPEGQPAVRVGGRWGLAALYLALSGLNFLLDKGQYILVPFFAACLTATIYLFSLALRPVPESLGWEAPNDSTPVGERAIPTPRQAFRSMLPELQIMTGLHYLCSVIAAMVSQFIQSAHAPGVFDPRTASFFLFLNSCPIAALFMGAMLASSMWVLTDTKFVRVLAIAGLVFGWIIQYWMIFFIVAPAMRMSGAHIFLVVLLLSLILPWVVVCWAWSAAERKLAGARPMEDADRG